jgi:hypothetical protein
VNSNVSLGSTEHVEFLNQLSGYLLLKDSVPCAQLECVQEMFPVL